MAYSGNFPSRRDPGTFPSTTPQFKGKLPVPSPFPKPNLDELLESADSSASVCRASFLSLAAELDTGSILFPGCKAYEQAIFVGNLLYSGVTPSAIVQAVTVDDVVATVNFVRKVREKEKKKNPKKKPEMELTVKSGGHSAGGYCLNDKGVVLDISSMNEVRVSKDRKSVTVAGGALWWDVYTKLREQDLRLVAVGGNCPTVGVSAFIMGGGCSPYSRCYGLGIDSLLKMTLVTADGKTVTVTHEETDQHKKDLFWAVRGGGGGNFGVTVEVVLKVHELRDPLGTVVSGNLTWNLDLPHEKERFDDMMKVWNETKWPPEVRGDAIWRYDDNFQLLGQMTIVYNGNKAKCDEAIRPLLNFRPSKNELAPMHWLDWESIDGKIDVFQQIYQHHASFIFGHGGITPKVAEIIVSLMRDKFLTENKDVSFFILWHHIGEKTEEPKPTDTAFFWRKGHYVFHLKVLWTEAPTESSSESSTKSPEKSRLTKEVFDFINVCKARLGPFSLDGEAAYVNFIDPTENDWPKAYYGDNYKPLCDIKKYWDPNNFFQSPQGINPPRSDSRLEDEKLESGRGLQWSEWAKYAPPVPMSLGNPKTTDEAFSMAAAFRRSTLISASSS